MASLRESIVPVRLRQDLVVLELMKRSVGYADSWTDVNFLLVCLPSSSSKMAP